MAGNGVEIGKNVLIVYNDPTPNTIRSLGYSSKSNQASDWIIPGYYYPLGMFSLKKNILAYLFHITHSSGCMIVRRYVASLDLLLIGLRTSNLSPVSTTRVDGPS